MREQILGVVYIYIPRIVAILGDDNLNGEYHLDNQNLDKVFLDEALHSYSICVHQNHVSGPLFQDKLSPHLHLCLKMVFGKSILSNIFKLTRAT